MKGEKRERCKIGLEKLVKEGKGRDTCTYADKTARIFFEEVIRAVVEANRLFYSDIEECRGAFLDRFFRKR